MRKLTAVAIAAIIMAITVPAFAGGGGDQPVQNGYYTIIWELPEAPTGNGENAPWPQTYVAHEWTGGLDTKPDLAYLDGVVPECGWFQIDVYKIDSERDRQRLTAILDAGILNWPDDTQIYHSSKFVEKEPCTTTTTSSHSTSTSTIGTTTTTERSTTTTLSETTTTAPTEPTTSAPTATTSPTVAPSSTAPATTPSPTVESLPETGGGAEPSTLWIAGVLGVVMGAAGITLVVRSHRLTG